MIAKRVKIVVLIVFLMMMSSCKKTSLVHGNGLFSWQDVFAKEKAQELFVFMNRYDLHELYQYISEDVDEKTIEDFVSLANEYNIAVYQLLGERKWGLDPEGEELKKAIRKLDGLKGVVVDVETYLLDEWDEEVFASYYRAMKAAKKKTKTYGYEMILCIPYYLDDYPYLNLLVKECCDTLAVMNYYRKNEALHIKNEADLCKKYHKRLINIYEFQKAGIHSLQEVNTYHEEGYEAMMNSFKQLNEVYNNIDMNFAWHDYKAVYEVIGHE